MLYTHPDSFKSGVRILKRLSRNKDGAVYRRRTRLEITKSAEEFDSTLAELVEDLQDGERIYGSVDARDEERAVRLFKLRQLNNDYERSPANFYHRSQNVWASCLEDPTAAASKLFLFDLDDRVIFQQFADDIKGHIPELLTYPTKSGGWHVITSPFNPTVLSDMVRTTLHRNASMLWAYK